MTADMETALANTGDTPNVYQPAIDATVTEWAESANHNNRDDWWSEQPNPNGDGFVDVNIYLCDLSEDESFNPSKWYAVVYPVVPIPDQPDMQCTDSQTILAKLPLGDGPGPL